MDINDRLQQSQKTTGTPKLNPDEQNRYLGTFRERVLIAIKASQITDTHVQNEFLNYLKNHSDGKVLINQNLAQSYFTTFVKQATATHHPFTLLSDHPTATQHDDAIAVLLASDHAVNIDNIYIS